MLRKIEHNPGGALFGGKWDLGSASLRSCGQQWLRRTVIRPASSRDKGERQTYEVNEGGVIIDWIAPCLGCHSKPSRACGLR